MTFLLKSLVHFYRYLVSPFLHWIAGPGCGCRFEPSCSCYLLEAFDRHGAWHGTVLGIRRLLRCNPWGSCGYDPVPEPRKKSSFHGS